MLRGNTHIRRLELRGFTATDESRPSRLSRKRALAVRERLIGFGVDSARLNAVGKGVAAPDKRSKASPAYGRRVEFVISHGNARHFLDVGSSVMSL